MKVELKIYEILESGTDVDNKVKSICKFMGWDKKKLSASIIRNGTHGDEARVAILNEFWDKDIAVNVKKLK